MILNTNYIIRHIFYNLKDIYNYCYDTLANLTYEYDGKQLLCVNQAGEDYMVPTYVHAMHFTDGADEDVEYEYNANGSLTADLNKGITGITYNAIGLPEIIMWNINKSLSFAYAADGRKLRRTYFYWRNANLHGGGEPSRRRSEEAYFRFPHQISY